MELIQLVLAIFITLSPLLLTSFILHSSLKNGVCSTCYWWLKMQLALSDRLKLLTGLVIVGLFFSHSLITTLQTVALQFSNDSRDVIYLGDKQHKRSYFAEKNAQLTPQFALQNIIITHRSFEPIYRSTEFIRAKKSTGIGFPAYFASLDELNESLLTTLLSFPVYLFVLSLFANKALSYKKEFLQSNNVVSNTETSNIKRKVTFKKQKGKRALTQISNAEIAIKKEQDKQDSRLYKFFIGYVVVVVLLILQQLISDNSTPTMGPRYVPLPATILQGASIEAMPIAIRKIVIDKTRTRGTGADRRTEHYTVDTGYRDVTFRFEQGFITPVYVSARYHRKTYPYRYKQVQQNIRQQQHMRVKTIKNLTLRIIE